MAKKAKQLTPRQIAGRLNGTKGGLGRAKKLTKKAMQAIASMGGKTVHKKLGDDYFSYLAARRKTVGRYRTPAKGA